MLRAMTTEPTPEQEQTEREIDRELKEYYYDIDALADEPE